jgi:hypothetical protein
VVGDWVAFDNKLRYASFKLVVCVCSCEKQPPLNIWQGNLCHCLLKLYSSGDTPPPVPL